MLPFAMKTLLIMVDKCLIISLFNRRSTFALQKGTSRRGGGKQGSCHEITKVLSIFLDMLA